MPHLKRLKVLSHSAGRGGHLEKPTLKKISPCVCVWGGDEPKKGERK